jgi:hypothetical protein
MKNEEERDEWNPPLESWAGTVVESNANEMTLLFADSEQHTIPTSETWTGHTTTEIDESALPSKKSQLRQSRFYRQDAEAQKTFVL